MGAVLMSGALGDIDKKYDACQSTPEAPEAASGQRTQRHSRHLRALTYE